MQDHTEAGKVEENWDLIASYGCKVNLQLSEKGLVKFLLLSTEEELLLG